MRLHTMTSGAMALVVAGFAAAIAMPPSFLFVMLEEADYTFGCYEPCACPISMTPDVRGTMALTPNPGAKDGFAEFTVDLVEWLVRFGDDARVLTGGGVYRVSTKGEQRHQLVLTLSTDGGDAEVFDSGLMPGGGVFPSPFTITIDVNDMFCLDTVITVAAAPYPAQIADVDGNGQVDSRDLGQLLGSWGTADFTTDLDFDGTVGAADLAIMLGQWGPAPG
ncbi:MAG: hypothetical protein VYC34_02570 [Planctomycetota bacterium]|nr:hypothetical protein [Planctomycetota bacterium]